MKENWKKFIAYIVVLVIGIGIGIGGYWYYTVKIPEQRAYQLAQREQERLNNMVRSGQVQAVKGDELDLQLTKKGREDIKDQKVTEKIKVTDNTILQEGMNQIKPSGESFLLKDYIHSGMKVDILVENGEALVIHFDKKNDFLLEQES